MSGKAILLNLLNGNSCIATYPYHKFGFSLEYRKFQNFLMEIATKRPLVEKFFEDSEKNTIKVKLYEEKKIYKINISELILFIIKNNASIPYLFEAHYSKKLPALASDSFCQFVDIDFDFNLFINSIKKNIDLYHQEFFELEDLDDMIFNSFLNSTGQYTSNLLQFEYYCQCTSNSFEEINFLLKNYENLKLIYIKRDSVSRSYSIAKRLSSKSIKSPSKSNIKKIMFNYIYNIRKIVGEDFNNIEKNSDRKKLLIVNFEDFFNKREKVMQNICNFLNIKYEKSMMQPHVINHKINNPNFLKNNMNDDPNELFSKKELNEIRDILNSRMKLFFYKYLYRILDKLH